MGKEKENKKKYICNFIHIFRNNKIFQKVMSIIIKEKKQRIYV